MTWAVSTEGADRRQPDLSLSVVPLDLLACDPTAAILCIFTCELGRERQKEDGRGHTTPGIPQSSPT